MTLGYNRPLYILLFDHRATFKTGMFGWKGPISQEQTAQIAAASAARPLGIQPWHQFSLHPSQPYHQDV